MPPPVVLAWAMAAVALLAVPPAAAQAPRLEFGGSLKSLVLRSRDATGVGFGLNLNRLRLQAQGELAPGLAIDLQYDNELLLGSYLDTAAFRAAKELPGPQYWRADANYLERGDVYGRHRLYRASATVSVGAVDVKLGRQRIAWGTGRFWSPLDILNPVDPIALEREERPGVDAALVEARLGPLARLSAVWAPAPDRGSPSRALQWHGNAAGVDASLVIGRLRGTELVGVDLASQIGAAGIRGEAAWLRSPAGPSFARVLLGADYAFSNGLTLTGELYHNGAGARDPAAYDLAGQRAGRVTSLATRYAGLYAAYEITPLLKWVTYAVVNADDRSRAVDTRLVWSWRDDLELTLGAQRFCGSAASEYGRLRDGAFAALKWFF
ncbi:MAG: hypothetical protein IPM99_07095 [Rubrivivax sp.]|nr:hypothetical protein [Rubrivivax sp.]